MNSQPHYRRKVADTVYLFFLTVKGIGKLFYEQESALTQRTGPEKNPEEALDVNKSILKSTDKSIENSKTAKKP